MLLQQINYNIAMKISISLYFRDTKWLKKEKLTNCSFNGCQIEWVLPPENHLAVVRGLEQIFEDTEC